MNIEYQLLKSNYNKEYVSGELFCSLCDIAVYDYSYVNTYKNIQKHCKYIIYHNKPITENIKEKIHSSVTFFVKTDYLDFFINCILIYINKPFILFTHNSDLYSGTREEIINHDYLLKWFGQNMIGNSNKVEGIPIGLENSQWPGSNYETCLHYYNLNLNNKLNNVYINFSTSTNKNRIIYYNFLFNHGFKMNERKKWETYIQELSTYKYCFCPEGNGIDTHRLWECIYTGCIPIVFDGILKKYFKHLPILWIDSIEELINEKILKSSYDEIISKRKNLDKTTLIYWHNYINDLKI
jgi:hypothetical protein